MASLTDLCGVAPISLLEALANTIYINSAGQPYVNVKCIETECDDVQAASCGDASGIDYEQYLISKMFALDDCGKFAIKIGGICLNVDRAET